ncbi:MAG: hypothetical protein ACK4QL_08515 [Pseudanabaenaceae cyanobacterium]
MFECVLEAKKFDELLARLKKRFNLDEDNVWCYPISTHTLTEFGIRNLAKKGRNRSAIRLLTFSWYLP